MKAPLFSIHETPDKQGLRTTGLRAAGLSDFSLRVVHQDNRVAAQQMLEILARYEIDNKVVVKAGEKIRHGYWAIRVDPADDGTLEIFESTADGSAFVPGANLALKYWSAQHEVCARAGATFAPPLAEQMVAISAGVLEGCRPLDGVRYIEPPTMSGWFFTTNRYSGNVEDLKVQHLYHVTAARPELAQFLALPPGFRIRIAEAKSEVYFDQTVLDG